ncbi:chloride channel protein [Streptomyces violascens]|uniref:Chloride channel protein n=1 Tax=Streptomyces violascens TaxID=67381 RepID=A0ABQ3QXR3_9ACTN|nr:chloride channel protein [Streptomyces violascens]GGU18000.1 chloride channel protein [Streptomyces violascens]GHI42048.1 chloride channel protein [Streptomyces violascens]
MTETMTKAAGAAAPPGAIRPVPWRERVGVGVREAQWGLAVLALVIGAGAGLGSIAFRWLIKTFTGLFSGHADYAAAGHAANPHVSWLGPYFVLLAPVIGGLLYGPLVDRFAKEARGHGVPEVMLAVAQRGGRINPQVSVVKALASALTIGSGGSVGREGPIVQIGSALGSTLGRIAKVTEGRMKLLVACGAAGGIAATFNAPLAGVFFAMELILRDFAIESFGAVVISSVAASVIGRAAFGDVAFLNLPAFHVDHVVQYGLFAVLGVVAGGVGIGFTRILYWIEDACDWAWRGPEWLRPAVGGLLLGVVLLVLPEMYGVGYPVLENAAEGKYAAAFLLLLLVGKILATSLTIGIGGSGGVFAPSLFMGAMLGAAYGAGMQTLMPSTSGAVGAYALVGMGAVFAGASRAPITAVVILFELTGEYSIILPLMLAIVTATLTSKLLSRDTVYTLKLRRRGIDLDGPATGAVLGTQQVDEVMEQAPGALAVDAGLSVAAMELSLSAHGVLPVTDKEGHYLGTITARAVAEALTDEPGSAGCGAIAGDLVERPASLTADMSLAVALHDLISHPGTGLPVLDSERARLVGWLTHQSALRALHPVRA